MSNHGAATALKRETLGIFLSIFILILCNSIIEKNEKFLVWEHVVSNHRATTALRSEFPFLCIFVYMIICPPVHENLKHFLV